MNIHRIYIYAPVAGIPPVDLEQALAQGEQLRQLGGGHEVPRPLLVMAEQIEEYARGLSEGIEGDEPEDDPTIADMQELFIGLKEWLLSQAIPVISFDMPAEKWQQLLWMIVEAARKLNLIVVDSQLMLVFLPSGNVYPKNRQAEWDEISSYFHVERNRIIQEKELPKNLKGFITWSGPLYEDYFRRHGFCVRGRTSSGSRYYLRDFGVFSMRAMFDYQMDYPLFSGLCDMAFCSSEVCRILSKFSIKTVDDIVFYIFLQDQAGVKALEERPALSKEAVMWEIDIFDRSIMKAIEGIVDINTLDSFFADPVGLSEISKEILKNYIPHQLVIARLAGQRDFKAVVSDLRGKIPPLHKKSLDVFDALVEYLVAPEQPQPID